MTIVRDALSILDEGRAILDDVGLRVFRVYVRTTDWSGNRVGVDSKITTTTELTVARGGRPKVRQLSADQVVNSGLELGSSIYDVTLTPSYPGGGVTSDDVAPPVPSGVRREVQYLIFGPGYEQGSLCKLVSANTGSPFRTVLRLQATGDEP